MAPTAADSPPHVITPTHDFRPCIVSHRRGPVIILILLASFRGNCIDAVDDLLRFFCVSIGLESRGQAALSGRPALDTLPTWKHPDGRKCYALGFYVKCSEKDVERRMRGVRINQGFDEQFRLWVSNRVEDLVGLPGNAAQALVEAFLRNKRALGPAAMFQTPTQDQTYAPTHWVPTSPGSWVSRAFSSYSFASSVLSSHGLNPTAPEFKFSGTRTDAKSICGFQSLGCAEEAQEASEFDDGQTGKENMPPY
ncbi:hypothetical protein EXIGLDRAFT_833280 [Exidia glandulosa HHB12029]|uniref:Uncharacterized protein n=1 Tax=Exidia glandulosa HHB12029 TaxID=1314781 RepID=A0A165KTI0_EXIGL|nr:hypothetical protein EXIGLDRAFT_833280 [Exidia glandulosa HHB12029]